MVPTWFYPILRTRYTFERGACHDVNYPVLVPIRTDQQIPADFVDISPISRA